MSAKDACSPELDKSEDMSLPMLFAQADNESQPRRAASFRQFQRESGETLTVELIGHHGLWSHCLWNAGIALARYIDAHPALVQGRSVIEFGCGAALPSFISYLQGASRVVCTEYPDVELLQVVQSNIDRLFGPSAHPERPIVARGLRWDQREALAALRAEHAAGYDISILSDLIFNHSQHRALLSAVAQLSHAGSQALVTFSHHRPKFVKQDLDFFRMASEEFRFHVQKLHTFQYEPMFQEDSSDPSIRSQVHFYLMSLSQ